MTFAVPLTPPPQAWNRPRPAGGRPALTAFYLHQDSRWMRLLPVCHRSHEHKGRLMREDISVMTHNDALKQPRGIYIVLNSVNA